ncbi:MAG: hypothetical protein AAF585_06140 [Verrucomicrobiota bacterium]
MHLLIWFCSTMILTPLVLLFVKPEGLTIHTERKVLLAAAITVVEFYTAMTTPRLVVLASIFAAALIFGPLICRFPFQVGLKFALLFCLAKVLVYLPISFFY